MNILAFIVLLSVVVVVHEMGHYWVARWCGVKVLRFSLGMGKIVFSRRLGADQTEWAISALPLGGYVKMLDARDKDQDFTAMSEHDLKREFTRQKVWRRIAIVAAGPLANFLLAILVYSVLNMSGVPEPAARIGNVAQQTPAYVAGLRGGERVTAIDGQPVQTWSELRWKIMHAIIEKSPARLDVERLDPNRAGGKLIDTVVLPLAEMSAQDLDGDFLAKLGIGLAWPTIVEEVTPGGAAQRAGLQKADQVTDIDGKPIADSRAFLTAVRASANKPLLVQGLRAGRGFSVTVTPEAQQEGKDDKNGDKPQGKIGALLAPPEMITVQYRPLQALGEAAGKTWDTSFLSIKMIGKMLVGQVSWKNITGPITIADYAGQTAKGGFISFLGFIAFISISLGVMNLLPIPVLDGGLLLYYSLEVLTGRPVPDRYAEFGQRVGFGILMVLMAVAFYNDIVRLINRLIQITSV